MGRVDGWIRPSEPSCAVKLTNGVALGVALGIVAGMVSGGAACLRLGSRGRDMSMRLMKHSSVGIGWGVVVCGLSQASRC
ncbi:reactive oxygen species modulator 1-like [Panonychus citri]|uniref:reactive oxygen species modulator 1-like n=1 Tax=Panonychus citri TaxID=50023 RepID=UPI002307C74A|nr:reactive oxygen species modulator 1-like [Panonychus citri]